MQRQQGHRLTLHVKSQQGNRPTVHTQSQQGNRFTVHEQSQLGHRLPCTCKVSRVIAHQYTYRTRRVIVHSAHAESAGSSLHRAWAESAGSSLTVHVQSQQGHHGRVLQEVDSAGVVARVCQGHIAELQLPHDPLHRKRRGNNETFFLFWKSQWNNFKIWYFKLVFLNWMFFWSGKVRIIIGVLTLYNSLSSMLI